MQIEELISDLIPQFRSLILKLALTEIGKLIDPDPKILEKHLEEGYFSGLMVSIDETYIACVTYYFEYSTYKGAPTMIMDDLFVEPGFRRKGVATMLINRLRQIARDRGCNFIKWSVDDNNLDAINFYKKLGAHVECSNIFHQKID